MINRNMNSPFFLRPVGKDYLWGGNRLNEVFHKNIEMTPLAETWECSTHPDGTSIVASGEWEGQLLSAVLKAHPEYLGTHPREVMRSHGLPEQELPILIKFIDARKDLSIQVHPGDAYAYEKEQGQLGKTEMWYVLDATEDASLIYGLNRGVSAECIREAIAKGSLEKYLQRVNIRKNDVFFIPAGTIHAIGAGALIAEIQENSNLTYRLYDYGRVDKNGFPRKLHVDKALEVADLTEARKPVQPMRVLRYRKGVAMELLCRCEYFQVERVLLNTENDPGDANRWVPFHTESNSFAVFLCVDGCGTIDDASFHIGDCVFLPADSKEVSLRGTAQFLKVSC